MPFSREISGLLSPLSLGKHYLGPVSSNFAIMSRYRPSAGIPAKAMSVPENLDKYLLVLGVGVGEMVCVCQFGYWFWIRKFSIKPFLMICILNDYMYLYTFSIVFVCMVCERSKANAQAQKHYSKVNDVSCTMCVLPRKNKSKLYFN